MLFWHGVPLGVDFRGGTLVYVKFTHPPDDDQIRAELDRAGLHNARIQRYGQPANNEVLVSLDIKETSEAALDQGKNQIIQALETPNPPAGKQDLNNAGVQAIQEYLLTKDPLHLGTDAAQRYGQHGAADRQFPRQDPRRRARFVGRTASPPALPRPCSRR